MVLSVNPPQVQKLLSVIQVYFLFYCCFLFFIFFVFLPSGPLNRPNGAGCGAQTAEAGAELRFRHLEKRAATEGEGGGAGGADPGAHKVYIVKELCLSSCLVSAL